MRGVDMVVGRQRGQTVIFNGISNSEMIERLVALVLYAKQAVDLIIEKAADPGTAQAMGFGSQVERLADHTAFPVQMTVAKWHLSE